MIVSANPGIEDAGERAAQRAPSRPPPGRRARGRDPFEEFIERWRTQPLFAQDPPGVGALAREDQRRNRPEALAAVLRGIGTGEMEPLWDGSAELEMPVSVIAGERDVKFADIGSSHGGRDLPAAATSILAAGGHGLPLENPQRVARG